MSLAVATRYANALVDVVIGSNGAIQPELVTDQLRTLDQAIQQSADFRNVLLSPAISQTQKNAVMGKLADRLGMHPLVRNFIFIVVRNRRGNLFTQIRSAFERGLDARTGVVKADVSSASELSDQSRSTLEAQLGRMTGKRVRCLYSVDQSLVGGAIARIGSTVYDGSVRGQLETLRRKLSTGA